MDYLEEKYASHRLRNPEDQSALDATKGIFPAMAKLVKSEEAEEEMEGTLMEAAKRFQEYWENKKNKGGCNGIPAFKCEYKTIAPPSRQFSHWQIPVAV